jgi:hypothetical protein
VNVSAADTNTFSSFHAIAAKKKFNVYSGFYDLYRAGIGGHRPAAVRIAKASCKPYLNRQRGNDVRQPFPIDPEAR